MNLTSPKCTFPKKLKRQVLSHNVSFFYIVSPRGRKPGSGRKNGGAGSKGKDKKLSGTESEQEVGVSLHAEANSLWGADVIKWKLIVFNETYLLFT